MRQFRIGFAMACAGLAGGSALGAEALYRVTDLGVLGCIAVECSSVAYDINAAGLVVGQSSVSRKEGQAFLWDTASGMVGLGVLAVGDVSSASGINAAGQVVGTSGGKAFLWEPATGMWSLGALPGYSTLEVYAISAAGIVVGTANGSRTRTAFRWRAGYPLQELPDPTADGDPYGDGSEARGVNASGQLAGSVNHHVGPSAAVWRPDTGWEILSKQVSVANAINDRGTVVGQIHSPTNPTVTAALWQPLTEAGGPWMQRNLGDLAGGSTESVAEDINVNGIVVGTGTTDEGSRAFVWSEAGGIRSLESLIDPKDRWYGHFVPEYAYAINDGGQIVGQGLFGSARHAYLLTPTPVPEPAAWAMFAAGLTAIGSIAKRRRKSTAGAR